MISQRASELIEAIMMETTATKIIASLVLQLVGTLYPPNGLYYG